MTVSNLVDLNLFEVISIGNITRKLSSVFCCDLLSIAMGKAPADSAWVTVMGNRNTLAVASLADVSCVILAEGAVLSEEDLQNTADEEYTVLRTELPIFETALHIHELIKNEFSLL